MLNRHENNTAIRQSALKSQDETAVKEKPAVHLGWRRGSNLGLIDWQPRAIHTTELTGLPHFTNGFCVKPNYFMKQLLKGNLNSIILQEDS